ncbi:MAG: arginine deiminase-related protein [Bacteroidota bacterium]
MPYPTTTDIILMVRPARFGFNSQTAKNNSFQTNDQSLISEEISERARQEFDVFVDKLRSVGVHIIVVEDTAEPVKHDAVFPNNWFSTHPNGLLITYPVFSPMRRLERREDIVHRLQQEYGYKQHIRLEIYEATERYLEGTGSLILDREHQVAYACRSIRTDDDLVEKFVEAIGFEQHLFDAVDRNGEPIYHTNVMMALGISFCVICLDSIPDPEQRRSIVQSLEGNGKEVVAITMSQLEAFAGNMIQVNSATDGTPYLVMSQQAYESLAAEQITQLEKHTQLLYSDLRTIETYGGGSARCMMAEIYPAG